LGIYSDVFADLISKVTCQGKYVTNVANLLKKGQVLLHHGAFKTIAAAAQLRQSQSPRSLSLIPRTFNGSR
jgi:hypothetical protein